MYLNAQQMQVKPLKRSSPYTTPTVYYMDFPLGVKLKYGRIQECERHLYVEGR